MKALRPLHLAGAFFALAASLPAQSTAPTAQPVAGIIAATTTTDVVAGTAAAAVAVASGPVRHVTVSVTLADPTGIVYVGAPPSPTPVNVEPGATLRLTVPFADDEIGSVAWYKAGTKLATTASTLEIPSVVAADTGSYSADVTTKAGVGHGLTAVPIRVETPRRQRLMNLSTRATITASNPTLIAGFVVDASPGSIKESKTLLIRAVGPSLAKLGVAKPLAAPRVQLFDSAGQEIKPEDYARIPELLDPYVAAERAAPVVGATPFDAGTKDYGIVWSFRGGPFTVHVSSANGGTGDVVLEVYELPESFSLWML